MLIADFARNLEDRISTSAQTAGNVAQPARRINVSPSAGRVRDQDQDSLRSPDLIGPTDLLRSGGRERSPECKLLAPSAPGLQLADQPGPQRQGGAASASGGRT